MDVFKYAMQMELDGKAYYEKMAAQAENELVKNILTDLAKDEQKHYNIFKRFSEGDFSEVEEFRGGSTRVLTNAKNIFQKLSSSGQTFDFGKDLRKTWLQAQEIEKKSEDFYREKATAEKNAQVKKTLGIIADEEHKHWVLIENVLHFLDRPKQWLEDAEWNNMESY
nr:ferritin family protein [candidate division Zixibacteria bacterium]